MEDLHTILLVEDDTDDQYFFKEALQAVAPGSRCVVASNGYEALHRLLSLASHPDLIFIDLNMPMMNGTELLESLKNDKLYAAFKDIPVVVLTTSAHDEERCLQLGANLYQVKPLTIPALERMLKGIFRTI